MGHHPSKRSTPLATTVFLLVGAVGLFGGIAPVSAAPGTLPANAEVERDQPAEMIDVDPADFVEAAAELPAELEQALARDVGLSGAEWLAQSEAGNAAADVVAELAEVIEVVDARLENYELVVTVETAADARIAQSVGARVEFGSASDERATDIIEGLEPANNLRGGMPYTYNETEIIPADPDDPESKEQVIVSTFRCSIGFVGQDVNTEQLQIMSAGHCEGDEGSTRTARSITKPTISGGTVGSVIASIGPADEHVTDEHPNPGFFVDPEADPLVPIKTYYDLGMTSVTTGGWVGKPEIVTWGNSTSGAPLATDPLVIRDAGPAIEGSTVCKSGSTTGWTCGPITAIDAILVVGSSAPPTEDDDPCDFLVGDSYCSGSIVSSICVRPGDSGGPAVVGSRAVGITSATTRSSGSCSLGGTGVFSTLYSPEPAYEQVTKIFPDWEPLVGFQSTNRNSTATVRLDPSATPNLLGRVTGGSTRHSVDVSINGAPASSPTVASNGNWSVPLSGMRGTINWSASAQWGSQTQSTASTGRILVASQARLSGSSRFDTAIAISKYAYPGSPNVPVVYIANGFNFPDALSAGPAAAAEGGPLLLTEPTSLPSAVRTELNRLNPTTIVIVGGTSVVSPAVARALGSFADSVVRIGGANRYETSRLITQRGISRGFFTTGQQVWVATGANYADALSAGAAAASAKVPILLVDGAASSIDSATRTFLASTLKPTVARIAGGTAVVSNGVKNDIDAVSGVSTARYGGANRFATSLVINQFAHPGDVPEAFLTYGLNFPDALAGGVVAGLRGGPMYITQTGCVERGVVNHILDISPEQITVFGGTSVVSNNVRDLRRC